MALFQCPQHRAMHLTYKMWYWTNTVQFQCPQNRAMLLTTGGHLLKEETEFQCPQYRAKHLTGTRCLAQDGEQVSMPSISGDASDFRTSRRCADTNKVSMPSTSGDASGGKQYHVAHRALSFQCPLYRAMHVTLRPNWNGRSNFISMPSTSGDASDFRCLRRIFSA